MATKEKPSYFVSVEPDLRQFTLDFFAFFGVPVSKMDRRKNGALHVELPEDLATHFGKDELRLMFHNVDNSHGYDLVAHGSRTFDRMITFLDRRSALTLQTLPKRHLSSDELLRAIRPVNTSITNLQMQEQVQRLFIWNWRITYRADDKREELYSVVLDEEGQRIPLQDEPNAPESALDLDRLFADAEAVPEEKDENGQSLPPRLPPMTHLMRLAETARKYAIYHADLRCVSHEAEILPRLYQTLNRLTTYYGQQIEEVYDAHDPTGEKRRVLEMDLERKIAEEVENHRLRVGVALYSYAILQIPVAVAQMVLSDGNREAATRVTLDRYSGVLQRPECHVCGQEMVEVALDRNGHLMCDGCLRQCAACLDLLCADCGVEPCPVCTKEICDTCGQMCWACGGRTCPDHIVDCPVCGDAVCTNCQTECSACGVRQCRSHLRLDAVPDADGKDRWICADCAVRCPGCQQYSSAIGTCSASGQRFCENCLATCARCENVFGPGFYEVYPVDGKSYCFGCMQECPMCQTLTPDVVACKTCGKYYCYRCGLACDICHEHCCDAHAHRFEDCGHVVCDEHLAICAIGYEEVCLVCNEVCAICDRPHCLEHSAACQRCGCTYCSECVRASGLCDTCATIGRDGEPVRLAQEPCGEEPRVAAIASQFHWLRTGNHRYLIYLGSGAFMSGALVVVEKGHTHPVVRTVRKLGFLDTIRERFGR